MCELPGRSDTRVMDGPHFVEVVEVADGFQARCTCGWAGPVRQARATAENDVRRHQSREWESPYA